MALGPDTMPALGLPPSVLEIFGAYLDKDLEVRYLEDAGLSERLLGVVSDLQALFDPDDDEDLLVGHAVALVGAADALGLDKLPMMPGSSVGPNEVQVVDGRRTWQVSKIGESMLEFWKSHHGQDGRPYPWKSRGLAKRLRSVPALRVEIVGTDARVSYKPLAGRAAAAAIAIARGGDGVESKVANMLTVAAASRGWPASRDAARRRGGRAAEAEAKAESEEGESNGSSSSSNDDEAEGSEDEDPFVTSAGDEDDEDADQADQADEADGEFEEAGFSAASRREWCAYAAQRIVLAAVDGLKKRGPVPDEDALRFLSHITVSGLFLQVLVSAGPGPESGDDGGPRPDVHQLTEWLVSSPDQPPWGYSPLSGEIVLCLGAALRRSALLLKGAADPRPAADRNALEALAAAADVAGGRKPPAPPPTPAASPSQHAAAPADRDAAGKRPPPPLTYAAKLSAAASMMAREAAGADLPSLPGVDPSRLEIVEVTGPETRAAQRMAEHAGRAPLLAVDSEGTFDRRLSRDRMCLLALMAPACRGFPKGESSGSCREQTIFCVCVSVCLSACILPHSTHPPINTNQPNPKPQPQTLKHNQPTQPTNQCNQHNQQTNLSTSTSTNTCRHRLPGRPCVRRPLWRPRTHPVAPPRPDGPREAQAGARPRPRVVPAVVRVQGGGAAGGGHAGGADAADRGGGGRGGVPGGAEAREPSAGGVARRVSLRWRASGRGGGGSLLGMLGWNWDWDGAGALADAAVTTTDNITTISETQNTTFPHSHPHPHHPSSSCSGCSSCSSRQS